jgi:hypothetical protein
VMYIITAVVSRRVANDERSALVVVDASISHLAYKHCCVLTRGFTLTDYAACPRRVFLLMTSLL